MLGLRDIDPPEAEILKEHHIRYYKWDYIMEHGLQNCLNESIDYLSHCPAVHVSFDIDSMDPKLMPGVSVPVPEGFNEDDVFLMMDELLTRLPVQAISLNLIMNWTRMILRLDLYPDWWNMCRDCKIY